MNAGEEPTFSVVVPAWNNAGEIRRALDSLLGQPNLIEILVVDDGSSDGTAAAARAWASSSGQAVKMIEQANAGPSAARNRGAAEACGDYLVFLDADDRMLHGALKLFAAGLRRHRFPDMLIAGRIDLLPDGSTRIRRRQALFVSAEENFVRYIGRRIPQIGPGAAAIRREVFSELWFPEGLRVAEDTVFYALLLASRRCAAIAEPVVEIGIDERRQMERLRNNAESLLRSGEVLFDPKVMPEAFMKYRRLHDGRVHLSLFRAHHFAGARKEARDAWRRALRLTPGRALRWTYVKKLLLNGGRYG